MGKRYFCDFCDKSIPFNTENIKKHNEGSQHQTIRNTYYSKYKDLATILLEEREKKPCTKYFSSGYCSFGVLCRGSHRTKQQIEKLEDLYRLECHKKAKIEEEKEKKQIKNHKKTSNLNEAKQLLSDNLTREEEELLENYFQIYELPKSIKNSNLSVYLPPSLKPPTYKDYLNYEFNEWSSNYE